MKDITFAARMQHLIYWGGLKNVLEWSLKTWMAPWSYIASVIYHDMYWYPKKSSKQMSRALQSDWGRLFNNWENLSPNEDGWKDVGKDSPDSMKSTKELLKMALRVLGYTIVEAPEIAARRRRRKSRE
jgi:hypothetical protein